MPTRAPQKMAQLDKDKVAEVMDCCLVWHWLKPQLEGTIGATQMQTVHNMWLSGIRCNTSH